MLEPIYTLCEFIENIISFIKEIYSTIALIIKYMFIAIKIILIVLVITLIYKIVRFFRTYSLKKSLDIMMNKIKVFLDDFVNNILIKIGLIKKLSEKENDDHLKKQIEEEIIEKKINVNFDDIASLDDAKEILIESLFIPRYIPNFFKGLREPWKGLLLFGPPGTGKTLLAKAVACMGNSTFFNVKSSSFASKWVGESEKLVKFLFQFARERSPSIIFIDEIDSIARKRNEQTPSYEIKTLNELLMQMDGLEKNENIFVFASTNRPFDLDDAILRRFQKAVYIPLPDHQARKKMFEIFLKDNNYDRNINLDKLAKMTEGYNGSDIYNLCKESSYMILRKTIKEYTKFHSKVDENCFKDEKIKNKLLSSISNEDFMEALKYSKKSVSPESIEQYKNFQKRMNGIHC